MDLILNIDAVDKTAAAVVSASDLTPVDPLPTLVLGDVETITLQFVDEDGATPAFASDATYTAAVGLGAPTANGEQQWTGTTTFTLASSTRTGYVSLDTAQLRDAVYNGMASGGVNRNGAWFTLHVRITDPTGYGVTYALLPVFVAARVLPNPATTFNVAEGVYLQLAGGTLTGTLGINLNSTLSTRWFPGLILTGANATNTAWQIDSYGAQARYDFRRANGTMASPTALVNGNVIGGLACRGYDGSAYTATAGSLLFTAYNNWTGSSIGVLASLAVVFPGTTSQPE